MCGQRPHCRPTLSQQSVRLADIVGVRSGDGGVFPKDQKRQGFLKDTNEANKFREVHFFFIKVVATQIFLVSTPNPGEMIQFDYFVYYLG